MTTHDAAIEVRGLRMRYGDVDVLDGVEFSARRGEVLVLLGPNEAGKLADRILILSGGRIVANGSADRLVREVSSQAQVRWSRDGEQYVHATDDATRFVRELFAQHGERIGDLEVRRASLEDTYMAMVHEHEKAPR